MLKFSKANSKIETLEKIPALAKYLTSENGKARKVYSLDLLSGYSCPFAEQCLSKVIIDAETGKRTIRDGAHTEYRCFSASQEVIYTNTYNRRSENFLSLRTLSTDDMVTIIDEAIPANLGICRIHVAGDFFNERYFLAWLQIANMHPDRLFYAYTKSLPYWTNAIDDIPENLVLTASRGGRRDDLIEVYNLRSTVVVYSEQEAFMAGLEIDHDDSHAANPETRNKDFALLIHGVQPKGSEASEAIKKLKADGVKYSYSRA